MFDFFNLADLTTSGQVLACVDNVEYRKVVLVVACPPDGSPTIYCQRDDWEMTPAARLDSLLRTNATLLARVAALEAQLAAPAETPVQNQAAQFAAQAAYIAGESTEPIICPDCDQAGWKSARALQTHRQRAHQGMVAVRVPTQAVQFVEELGWHCAEMGCSGAFTRDMHDPAHCIKHAIHTTNGREVAA